MRLPYEVRFDVIVGKEPGELVFDVDPVSATITIWMVDHDDAEPKKCCVSMEAADQLGSILQECAMHYNPESDYNITWTGLDPFKP